ncbi:MAG: peptidase T [Planctomycetaceae bacterium]|jgi:tripeptide aminopeptidase|nr:peptidase T [Planctomycetaceae bacterium]
MHINRNRLLERFLQYVKIGSTANPNTQDYPSSRGQWLLGELLVKQMKSFGIEDAQQDVNGLVWGTVPATTPGPAPTILFNAHLDTSPEAPGDHCRPEVIESYQGGDIPLAGGDSIQVSHTPELEELIGKTLVVTDGRTLLGGDDKAGVAAIMEIANYLMERPEIPHGPIRILFTCDEEIGRGTRYFDLNQAGAVAGYTLDGGASGTIDVETFSADLATVKFIGHNTHPSVGKGKMVNALKAASEFVAALPTDRLSPETTSGREGFMHPYVFQGSVSEATVQILLRDFETPKLNQYASMLRSIADEMTRLQPRLSVQVHVEQQYRNLGDKLREFPIAADLAEQAYQRLGRHCKRDAIRGGSDGSLMSHLGLPTPNLSVGQYNIHSTKEFACLDQMVQAVEHAVVLSQLWGEQGRY